MPLSQKRKYIRIISFFVCLSVLFAVYAAVNAVKAHNYKLLASISNEKALNELCENLDNITTLLEKGMYLTKGTVMGEVEKELSKSAACAKISLSQLADDTVLTDEVYKFLSQVGAYTSCLVKKTQNGQAISTEEKEAAKSLYDYSQGLSEAMDEILDGYNENTVSFEKSKSTLKENENSSGTYFSQSVNDAEESFLDYPTLIYDGPFSDSILQRQSQVIADKEEVTAQEAKEIAAKYLSVQISELRQDADETSDIELYCFSSSDKSIGITKKGGYVCYILSSVLSGEENISYEEAIRRGEKELSNMGYTSLKESYYSSYDGICTVNFAYTNDGVIYYADLIKVSISLDTGKMVSLDARGYLTNHRERSLPEIRVTKQEAQKSVSENLTVIDSKIALIPTKYAVEKLCYEFHCKNSEEKEYLIYADVEMGQQEDVLILLYEDGGTLVK